METGKQGFVGAPDPSSSVSAQREDIMHGAQTSLSAVYFHALGGLPVYAHGQPPAEQDTVAFPLSAPQLSSKPALSLLTLHVASGVHLQQPAQRLGAVAAAAKPKSAGKHLCPFCGRDCLKPSVLEKHLRCHTGERPYPCTTCGVAFKTQSNLYKHKRTQAHARLSSDSERDSLSSQESVQGSRETSWSAPSLEGQNEGLESFDKDVVSPQNSPSTTSGSPQVLSTQVKAGSDTVWALQQAALVGLILAPMSENQDTLHSLVQNNGQPSSAVLRQDRKEDEERPLLLTQNRHLPLQRQEATLFSRASRGKSQNHDSTDSGFSEGSEQHWTSSPGSALHDHSMESLAESSTEDQEEALAPSELAETGSSGNTKGKVSLLEKRKLEERISRLISENDALVDDKQLENVRPRKTMPSKQGSIDLPMPYTYKDSFHFEMKTSRQTTVVSDWHKSERQVKQALYSSVPTQRSTSLEHAPLARSSSLPFNIGHSGFERVNLSGSCHSQSAQQIGRDIQGHKYPGDLLMRSVDQPISHHRSLVRQKAVDCLSSGESLGVCSLIEESYPSNLGADGDSTDGASESGGGKCRRKKTQKFPYNKWYMYGDGTFRKLYNTEKNSDRNTSKVKKPGISTEQGKGQESQNKDIATFKEPGRSGISTPDSKSHSSVTDSAGSPHGLLPQLPPSGRTDSEQDSSNLSTCLQKPGVRDLGVPAQLGIVKQSSIQMPDKKNDNGGKESNQEQQTLHLPPSQGLHHLPSERKKQRTDKSVHVATKRTDAEEGHSVPPHVIGHVEDNSILSQNRLLTAIKGPASQMFTKVTEQSRADRLPVERMDFSISSIEHHLNQKNVQLSEYPSPSKEVDSRQPGSKLNFLPKYQLKLPQPTESGRLASELPSGTMERNALSSIPGNEEKQTSTPDMVSAEGYTLVQTSMLTSTSSEVHTAKTNPASTDTHTTTPIPNSTERHSGRSITTATLTNTCTGKHLDILTSVSTDSSFVTPAAIAVPICSVGRPTDTTVPFSTESHCDTPASSGATLIPRDTPTSVGFSSFNSNSCFPEGESLVSSHLHPYKGQLTLLNGSPHGAPADTGLFREQRGDIQILLQIVSGDQLSAADVQQEPTQEAISSQDVPKDESKIDEAGGATQKLQKIVCHDMQFLPCIEQKNIDKELAASATGKVLTAPVASSWRTGLEFCQTKQHKQNERPSSRDTIHSSPIAVPLQRCSNASAQTGSTEEVQDRALPSGGAEGSKLSSSQTTEKPNIMPTSTSNTTHQEPSLRKGHPDKTAENRNKTEIKELAEVLTSVPTEESGRPHVPRDLKSSCHQSRQQGFKVDDVNRMPGSSCPYVATTGQQQQLTNFDDLAVILQNPSNAMVMPPSLIDTSRFSLLQQTKHKIFLNCELQHPLQPQFSHQWNSIGCPGGHVASGQPPQNQSRTAITISTDRTDKSGGNGDTDGLSKSQILSTSDPVLCYTDHIISDANPAAVSLQYTRPWLCKETNLFQKNQVKSLPKMQESDRDLSRPICMDSVAFVKPDLQLKNRISTNPLCAALEIAQHSASKPESQPPTTQNVATPEGGRTEKDLREVLVETSSQVSSKAREVGQQGACPAIPSGQQKLIQAGDNSFCPPSTAEITSGSVLVHITSQHKPSHQSSSSSVVDLKTESGNSVNEASDSSQTLPLCSAQGGEVSTSTSVGQGAEIPSFPVLHANPSKSRFLPNSDTCMAVSPRMLPSVKTEAMAATLMTSDVLHQTTLEPWGSTPAHAAGARLLMRSSVMISGDGTQDKSTAPQRQPQDTPQDGRAAGQGEVLLSCYASTSFCTQRKRSNGGTAVCDVKDGRDEPAAELLHGGSPSCGAPQGQQGAQHHSESDRKTGGMEGQDVVGVEGPRGGKKTPGDGPNGCKSCSSQRCSTSDTTVSGGHQMPTQVKTALTHTLRPGAQSESAGPRSRNLPVQKEPTSSHAAEEPALSGAAFSCALSDPILSETPGPQDVSCESAESAERTGSVRSHTGPMHCVAAPGMRARGLDRVAKGPTRGAQNVQEDGGDSSSSDDEGKLVIELDVT
ncbi:uncharacterized protein LOC108923449 [Scleropages formosus]|uniref:Uncharacterized LOC108923449 n=1 Tax=Scleropages formosus TaxID=113540 RepID=A0A8C9RVF4_SCLFO|nr:uncharacterized protein LOC108923449 [Scleropages formosus]